MRTRIKICGITRLEDAHVVEQAGADALGFVFAESPRRISPAEAGRIIASAVPPFVTPVGVFVDETPEAVAAIARQAGLGAVQLHGNESPEALRALGELCPARRIKAFRVRDRRDLERLAAYRDCCDAFLLDAFVPGAAGGTGKVFDWQLALAAKEMGVPMIVAGGLTLDNVGEAIRLVHPYAVDVSSGVEEAPGRKDSEKVRAFVEAVQSSCHDD